MPTSRAHAPSPPESRPVPVPERYELSVVVPYRLDLTVSALRRLSTNVVDVLTPDGQYVRALGGAHGPMIVRVTQVRPDALAVAIEGDASEHARVLALVRRMLGVDRELTQFGRAAARMAWLSQLARRMRGVKPPRYPTLWEAFVNAIAFQQVSLHAASAIVRRLIVAFGQPLESEGTSLYTFPSAEQVLGAKDDLLRATGLSAGKLATLRRAGDGLAAGTLAKGDVLAVARVAGILAAKRTPELVPLCHPVRTTSAAVELELDAAKGEVRVRATVEAVDRTGVEMEAMVAASVASLTVYDMIKSADRWATIEGVRLESKSGGKSGAVTRPGERS